MKIVSEIKMFICSKFQIHEDQITAFLFLLSSELQEEDKENSFALKILRI